VAPSRPMAKGKGGGSRLPAFELYDTRKYFPELCQRLPCPRLARDEARDKLKRLPGTIPSPPC